jgi:hypothetical protein
MLLTGSVVCFGLATVTTNTQGMFGTIHQQSEGRQQCTNRSLSGSFATMVEGEFLGVPAPAPLRSVALTKFDGRGNVSQVDHAVIGGMTPPVDWAPATGTYEVNPDCTGKSTLNIPGNPPMTIHFVIADDGNELLSVLSVPGTAITSRSIRAASR